MFDFYILVDVQVIHGLNFSYFAWAYGGELGAGQGLKTGKRIYICGLASEYPHLR